MDEVFLPGWRAKLEKVWQAENPTCLRYPYVFSWKDNEPYITMYNFKIHTRQGYAWRYPIHEVIEWTGEGEERCSYTEDIECHHFQDVSKPREYQKMLDDAVAENPNDPRMVHLQAREKMIYGYKEEAISGFKHYLKITKPLSRDFYDISQTRALTMRYIARTLKTMPGEHTDEILEWLLAAVAECPYTRENWIWLAQAWADIGNYGQVYACCTTGLRITDPKMSVENDAICWSEWPEKMAREALKKIVTEKDALVIQMLNSPA